jgi:hypothetical protein
MNQSVLGLCGSAGKGAFKEVTIDRITSESEVISDFELNTFKKPFHLDKYSSESSKLLQVPQFDISHVECLQTSWLLDCATIPHFLDNRNDVRRFSADSTCRTVDSSTIQAQPSCSHATTERFKNSHCLLYNWRVTNDVQQAPWAVSSAGAKVER